ncbi:nanos homolog 1-like [Dermochelys coriacea]|uniref:nanos homolog 1-like n=1 Tax=Dermochelys coriacea TaxID=27794 RepID=UPI001CA822E7|nr:nanos homolog 1-like [Dermochelys coriacea]
MQCCQLSAGLQHVLFWGRRRELGQSVRLGGPRPLPRGCAGGSGRARRSPRPAAQPPASGQSPARPFAASALSAAAGPAGAMDCLDRRCRDAATFDFWTDYLGLCALVGPARPPAAPAAPALQAAPCPCALRDGARCAPGPAAAAAALRDPEQRFALLRPFQPAGAGALRPGRSRASEGGCAPGPGPFELLGAEREGRRGPPAGGGRAKPEPRVCVFCRNNGAPQEVFGSHVLKSLDGRVLCPVLRAYTCPLCSARGDSAHTIKYCPLSRRQPPPRPLQGGRAAGRRLQLV